MSGTTEKITRKLMLYFPECETEKPIVYHLVKDYDLIINIFRARVTPEEEGYLVLDVTGTEENIEKGTAFIKSLDIKIDTTRKGVTWDKERCAQCGSCVPHCPTNALAIPDRNTMEVVFNTEECIECLSCIKVCPFGAMKSLF
ncbi:MULTISPECIES: 4Fe-4S binding protein [unclassified Oceanispirochaeta]|uniref:4Fe-4S binding protein n=1 Tax=unclassified Oceanispirochaeta TaxID=2635722 RepID=UPI000E09D8FB|nr:MULTISPECIES: 4Fe-4S binding protein [unclassified Oceanispirochaeta]MBF9018938.1 4Fe-4S binding protein [Oceanispirochaeta sp. M2]NPD75458.1 4Fe-4S binding protein [Oceanispirochaeta sp. M1]RDG28686.1 4Fe-4S dicluster domain-containing protein [Oceanispirochaeta sp. M1]